jgi:hypothetical protein
MYSLFICLLLYRSLPIFEIIFHARPITQTAPTTNLGRGGGKYVISQREREREEQVIRDEKAASDKMKREMGNEAWKQWCEAKKEHALEKSQRVKPPVDIRLEAIRLEEGRHHSKMKRQNDEAFEAWMKAKVSLFRIHPYAPIVCLRLARVSLSPVPLSQVRTISVVSLLYVSVPVIFFTLTKLLRMISDGSVKNRRRKRQELRN